MQGWLRTRDSRVFQNVSQYEDNVFTFQHTGRSSRLWPLRAMNSLLEQMALYSERFPFEVYGEEEIEQMHVRLQQSLPRLLDQCFRLIGTGHFDLTGGFFYCDTLGNCTESLLQELSNAKEPAELAPNLRFIKQPNWKKLLYIGGRDFFYNFIELDGNDDPIVYTCFEELGLHHECFPLSSVVASFKGFSQPELIPQSTVDEAWFNRFVCPENPKEPIVSNNRTSTLRLAAFRNWKKSGKPGLPNTLRSQPSDESVLYEGRILLNY